jgi:hypothetical protein
MNHENQFPLGEVSLLLSIVHLSGGGVSRVSEALGKRHAQQG